MVVYKVPKSIDEANDEELGFFLLLAEWITRRKKHDEGYKDIE